jgi:hypothetical protein
MKKIDIIREVYTEKQRRWACNQIDVPKNEREISKEKALEMCKDVKHSKKDITITKGKLKEYINQKTKVLNEESKMGFPDLSFISSTDKKKIFKYLETLRRSGIINMIIGYFMPGSEITPSEILTYTKKDLYRFLYGKKLDPDYLRGKSKNNNYDDEDNDYEDNDYEDNDYEDNDYERIKDIEYLLKEKDEIRNIIINGTVSKLSEMDFEDDDIYYKKLNREFIKVAHDCWLFFKKALSL